MRLLIVFTLISTLHAMEYESFIEKIIPTIDKKERLVSVDYKGQKLWLKRGGSARSVPQCLARGVFTLSPLAIIRTSPCSSSLDYEAKKLQKLDAFDLLTPSLLHYSQGWILINNIGKNLRRKIYLEGDVEKRKIYLIKAVQSLKKLHQKGISHGSGQLKDMVWNERVQDVGFINFSADTDERMPLVTARAQDLFFFVFSALPLYPKKDIFQALDEYAGSTAGLPSVLRELKNNMGVIKFVSVILTPFKGLLGRDLRHFIRAQKVLLEYFQK